MGHKRNFNPNAYVSYLEHLRVVSPSSPEEYPRRRSEVKKEDRVRVGKEKEKLKKEKEDIGRKE